MIVYPSPKLDSEESNIISSSFGIPRGNKSNEVMSKVVLNYLLKSWEESKTQSHPRFSDMTPSENISLKIFCIILK